MREWWGTDPTVDEQDAFTIVVDGEIAGWLGWYEETIPTTATAGWTSSSRPRSTAAGSAARRCGSAARWLIEERGHHRLIIDPAAAQRARDRGLRVDRLQARRHDAPLRARARRHWHDGLLMDLLAEEFSPS